MPPRGRFVWNEKAGRFRAPNGRFLSSRQVRSMIDRTLAAHTRAVAQLTEQLRQRAVSLAEWERRMRAEIKGIHLYSAMAAKGGRSQMTAADNLAAGRAILRQYRFLRRFADQIASGKQRLDGTVVTRTRLYAQSGRGSFEATRQRAMRSRGFDEERNVLTDAEHCDGDGSCVEQTKRGWVPIGALIPLGGRRCVTNDKCFIQYRNSETGEIAA
jgi:hypothetical protein